MKQRNYRTSAWIEVKPRKNKKVKVNEFYFNRKEIVGVVTKILKDGWIEVQVSGLANVKKNLIKYR